MSIRTFMITHLIFACFNAYKMSLPIQFGLERGDKVLKKNDDQTALVKINGSFKFLDKVLKEFYISPNGGILSKDYERIEPSDPTYCLPAYSLYPLWYDATFTVMCKVKDCNIFYNNNITDDNLLKIEELVQKSDLFGNLRFKPKRSNTLVVTWNNAPEYPFGNKHNTFQAILASDDVRSYIIYAYHEFQYPKESHRYPRIGLKGTEFCEIPGKNKTLCRSNIFVPGTFVVDVTYNDKEKFCPDNQINFKCSKCNGDEEIKCGNNADKTKICGDDYKVYESQCEFEKALCKSDGVLKQINCSNLGCDVDTCKHGFLCEEFDVGYKCHCKPPWTGTNCEILLACQNDNGGCEEMCGLNPATMSKKCTCKGKPLKEDGLKCMQKDYIMYGLADYIFVDSTNDFKVHNEAVKNQDIYLPNERVVSISPDYYKDILYYMDHNSRSIKKVFRNGTGRSTVLRARTYDEILNQPTYFDSVVFDDIGGNIYWTEDNSIYRYNEESKDITTIVTSDNYIRTLVLLNEPCRRLIYWAQVGLPEPAIKYTNMDNPSTPVTVVNQWIYQIIGMTVNHEDQKIYFYDNEFKRIESINYDGSCREILSQLSASIYCFGLVYHNNTLFYSVWNPPRHIATLNLKYMTESAVSLIEDKRSFGLAIYSPKGNYSCSNKLTCKSFK